MSRLDWAGVVLAVCAGVFMAAVEAVGLGRYERLVIRWWVR